MSYAFHLQQFFLSHCGSTLAPRCNGCAWHKRTMTQDPACTHPEHPDNAGAPRETARHGIVRPAGPACPA